MTTRAQRLRTRKAQLTRHFGPDDPATIAVGRLLALARLYDWSRSAGLRDWTESEFSAAMMIIERARAPRESQQEPPGKAVTPECDPFTAEQVTQASGGKRDLFRRKERTARVTPGITRRIAPKRRQPR